MTGGKRSKLADFSPLNVTVYICPLNLQFRHVFGTSHSQTKTRKNALVRVCYSRSSGTFDGFGEAGLPPVCPDVYFADYDSVVASFAKFCERLHSLVKILNGNDVKESKRLEAEVSSLRLVPCGGEVPFDLRVVFFALDTCSESISNVSGHLRFGDPVIAPACAAIEMALIDVCAKLSGLSLSSWLLGSSASLASHGYCYVTVSLGGNEEDIKEKTREARALSRYLKVKLGGDVLEAEKHLELIRLSLPGDCGQTMLSVDANAAWTAEQAVAMLPVLLKFGVVVCEQPFEATLGLRSCEINAPVWQDVKAKYSAAGIEIIADESAMCEIRPSKLSPFCHGVVVKVEKLGGLRAALSYVEEAKSAGLSLWMGQMAASALGSTAAAALLPVCVRGDLDGAFLVESTDPPMAPGVEGSALGHVISGPDGYVTLPECSGIGVVALELDGLESMKC